MKIMWGVFDDCDDGNTHVAPATLDGFLLSDHVLDTGCRCHPELDVEEPTIVIHNLPH